MQIIGHRGCGVSYQHPDAPFIENTLESIGHAYSKADGIECDVLLSKCGTPVIIHDCDLSVINPQFTGEVKDYTVEELQQLDLGRGVAPITRIPTLTELLRHYVACCTVHKRIFTLNIEIKAMEAAPATAILLRKFLTDYPAFREQIIVSSFNHVLLEYFLQEVPSIKRGVLFEPLQNRVTSLYAYETTPVVSVHPTQQNITSLLTRLKPATLHPFIADISPMLIESVNDANIGLMLWTHHAHHSDLRSPIYDLLSRCKEVVSASYLITDAIKSARAFVSTQSV